MLHRISPPSCQPALQWVVDLQRDLLTALCNPATAPETVTPAWVAELRPTPDSVRDWLGNFAARTFQSIILLDAMKSIAGLTPAQKVTITDYFSNNLQVPLCFDNTQSAPVTVSISNLGNGDIEKSVKVILNAFYGIALCTKGLPVGATGTAEETFNRSQFVDIFKSENNLKICPYCDGDMNGPEVDHWLPEGRFPALSCHPRNLVSICHECNSPAHKHQKPPISLGQPQPFADWFHPFERNAEGSFTIIVENGRQVRLVNHDSQMQRRLDNYDTLIDLTARWSDVYQQQSGDYLRKLRGKVRRNRMEPTEDDLLSTVQEWIEEIQDARDDRKNSIIKLFILQRASDKTSPQFMAWLSLINTA